MSLNVWQRTGTALVVGAATIAAPFSAMAQGAPPSAGKAPAGAAAPAAAAPAGAAPAGEDKQAEARSRYKAGLTLYEDGAYEAARVQFERAYELSPSYRILYNVGLVQKQLNEFVGALKTLERYLAEGGAEVPADRKAEVEKLIEQLKGIVAYVTVTANTPNAEVTVDDVVVGKAPLSAPVMLNPGRRKIGAKLPGKLPDAKVITVASGDKASVELSLGEALVINEGTDVKPIVAWAVTGGFAIGAGTLAFLANGASNDREDLLMQRDASADEISKTVDKQKTLALVSDICTVGAILSAGAAVYFTWFHNNDDGKSKGKEKPQKAQVIPGVGSVTVKF